MCQKETEALDIFEKNQGSVHTPTQGLHHEFDMGGDGIGIRRIVRLKTGDS